VDIWFEGTMVIEDDCKRSNIKMMMEVFQINKKADFI
jgi:hypothetical protein